MKEKGCSLDEEWEAMEYIPPSDPLRVEPGESNQGEKIDKNAYEGNIFSFDLSSGPIESAANAATVAQLVLSARNYSEDLALLQLIAQKKDLAHGSKRIIYWRREYHLRDRDKSEWISLKEWLSMQGYDMNN